MMKYRSVRYEDERGKSYWRQVPKFPGEDYIVPVAGCVAGIFSVLALGVCLGAEAQKTRIENLLDNTIVQIDKDLAAPDFSKTPTFWKLIFSEACRELMQTEGMSLSGANFAGDTNGGFVPCTREQALRKKEMLRHFQYSQMRDPP